MATLGEKRKEAKDLGIAATLIRSAENARELQKIIDDHNSGGEKPKVSKKKSVAKKSVAKKSTAKKSSAKKENSKSASSKSAPAKSAKSGATKAKRSATAKSDSDSGRNTLDGVDYNETDGWNARDGSAPDRIVKALKRFKGNRSKVFDYLVGDVWDFAGKKKRNGEKRTKPEAEAMLKYRIARTDWDFALRTGQHEKSGNRVEYGTGGTGAGTFKRNGSSKKSTSKSNSSTSKKVSKSSAKKSTAKATTGKKRGRPLGSKNKNTKAKAREAGKKAARKNKK